MNIARLVKKAKKGNKDALLQLIMIEKDAYYRLAFTYMRNEHDALEAMDEMIVTVYEKISSLKKNEAFYSWSKTILVNSCKTLLRNRKKVIYLDDMATVNGESTLTKDPYHNSEQAIVMEELLSHVNKYQREAIQLKYFHDLDYQTISEMTDVSVGTVKSRVFQGLKKLRLHYRGDDDE